MSEEEKECIKWTIKYAYMHICDFEPEESETVKKAEKAIETILAELEKKDKIIDAMLEEITDCEFEMQCSNCTYECEKDYDQLYECNKQYFERRAEDE